MPKQKITREMVVDAAFSLTREQGLEQVTVKALARRLGCSVQPIYSYCSNMEGLRQAVAQRAAAFVRNYVKAHADPEDLFRTTGQAYLRLAREEPHLSQLFLTGRREEITCLQDLYQRETDPQIAQILASQQGWSPETACGLHLHLLIYTIGLSTIFSVCRPGISDEEIFRQQELAYQAFFRQAEEQEGI